MKSLLSLSTVLPVIQRAKSHNQIVVLATGVFDLLHQEHINFLTKAKQSGDFLVVGLESDIRVKHLKGDNRPVNNQTRRAQNLQQLGFVDMVFILPDQFNTLSEREALIEAIHPDILAVSSHTLHLPTKRKILRKFGGRVKIVHSHNPQISSSQLLEASSHSSIYTSPVISGKGRGKSLGFPTLNLIIPQNLNVKIGIYAGWVIVGQHRYPGAFHFGPVPTFSNPKPSLEVFVLDHTFTPTPEAVSFQLVSYLRPIQTFSSTSQLARQISKDVNTTRRKLTQTKI